MIPAIEASRRAAVQILPYDPPAAYPYHVPYPCNIPTYDGTGSTIHPSVVDMGTRWNGYRFWMVNTPYFGDDTTLENPCVWGSHNGFDWQVPSGVTNPLFTPPSGYYSDTDVLYDPVGDRLVMVWRWSGERCYISASSDGRAWSAPVLAWTGTDFHTSLVVSPSLVRCPDGTWRAYVQLNGSCTAYLTAADPLGPWTYVGKVTGPAEMNAWHSHVMYDPYLNRYQSLQSGGSRSSVDGINWTTQNGAFLAGSWTTQNTYRACMRHRDADTYHVWYSARGLDGNGRTAYTVVPKTRWGTPT